MNFNILEWISSQLWLSYLIPCLLDTCSTLSRCGITLYISSCRPQLFPLKPVYCNLHRPLAIVSILRPHGYSFGYLPSRASLIRFNWCINSNIRLKFLRWWKSILLFNRGLRNSIWRANIYFYRIDLILLNLVRILIRILFQIFPLNC